MHIIQVFIRVGEGGVDAFTKATMENAGNSLREPGVARFDVLQQSDDPTRFVLIEVYRSRDDHAAHRETPHYKKWRETVADMMAEPRYALTYSSVFPDEQGW